MVLMGVGNDNTGQVIGAFGNKSRVGHLHVGLVSLVGVSKGDAAVDHEPLVVVAIQIEVHTDFATATQRQKPEISVIGGHAFCSSLKM